MKKICDIMKKICDIMKIALFCQQNCFFLMKEKVGFFTFLIQKEKSTARLTASGVLDEGEGVGVGWVVVVVGWLLREVNSSHTF